MKSILLPWTKKIRTNTTDMIQPVMNFARNVAGNRSSNAGNQQRAKSHFISLVLLMAIGMFLVNTGQIFATIAQRGTATTAAVTNNASLTITKPTGVVAGDIMIASFAEINSLTAPTAPAGWTSIDGRSLAGTTNRYASIFYKVAGGSEGANYTFTVPIGSTITVIGAIVAFSGVDGTTPFDVTNGVISVQASQTGVAATTKTTVTANAAIVMFGMAANSAPTWSGWTTTSPGALTELFDYQSAGTTTIGAAWALKSTAGATGAGAATLSGAERNGGILIALRPLLAPTIISFLPTSACTGSGQSVTIAGTNFTGATLVTFNGVSASYTVNSAIQITATLPAGATNGKIGVTTPSGSVLSASNFTVFSPVASVSAHTNVTCYAGTDGSITISGSGGTAPYQFSVDNGVNYTLGSNPNPYTYIGLSANIQYKIRVIDANGCQSAPIN
jgi:hypothetical protein